MLRERRLASAGKKLFRGHRRLSGLELSSLPCASAKATTILSLMPLLARRASKLRLANVAADCALPASNRLLKKLSRLCSLRSLIQPLLRRHVIRPELRRLLRLHLVLLQMLMRQLRVMLLVLRREHRMLRWMHLRLLSLRRPLAQAAHLLIRIRKGIPQLLKQLVLLRLHQRMRQL